MWRSRRLTYEDRAKLAEGLVEHGYDLLNRQRPREALRVARKVRRLRNSGSFDIAAMAYLRLGKRARAFQVLRKGVAEYPQVARLWSLLGSLHSDAGQWDEALHAFERASKGHGGNRAWADLDAAIVFLRLDDPVRALQKLDLIPPDAPRVPKWRIEDARFCALRDSGRYEEAGRVGKELLAILDDHVPPEDQARIRENVEGLFEIGQDQ